MNNFLKCFAIGALFFLMISNSFAIWPNPNPVVDVCQWWNCNLEWWAAIAKDSLEGINNEKSLSEYVIDIIRNLAEFLTLIWVIVIIYSWFTILVSWGDEEKLKSARRMILYVVLWILLIWLAYAIMDFIISILTNPDTP